MVNFQTAIAQVIESKFRNISLKFIRGCLYLNFTDKFEGKVIATYSYGMQFLWHVELKSIKLSLQVPDLVA